jgi:hypothetical protein
MGSKLKPGAFDCYANAAPDEPMFVLLARDKHAPTLVRAWADLREKEGEDPAKVKEARDCADAMANYRAVTLRRRYDMACVLSENLKIAVDEAEAILKAVGDNSSNARDIAVLAKLSKTNWRDVLDLVLRFEHKAS